MDLLNIQSGNKTASKPSLLSSLWSIQVQHQNEANTMIDDDVPNEELQRGGGGGGSQQSLPGVDVQMAYMYGGQSSLRMAKSLSDLTLCADASNPHHSHQHQHQQFTPRPDDSTLMDEQQLLSRQQKNNNICQWLQKLNLDNGQQWDSATSSPTITTSTTFIPQSHSCLLRSGTSATMDSTSSMDFISGGGSGGGKGNDNRTGDYFKFPTN